VTLSGSSITLDGSGAQTVSAAGGSLGVSGPLTKSTGGNLSLSAGTTLSAGALSASGGTLSASSGGAMTLGGNASGSTGLVLSSGGSLDADGNLSGGSGAVAASSAGAMTLAGNVTGGTDVTLSGSSIDFDGTSPQSVTAGSGGLTATASGSIILNGDLTASAGDINLSASNIELASDSSWTAGSMTVNAPINGARRLAINASNRAQFLQDIGQTTALSAFTANSGQIVFGRLDAGGFAFRVNALEFNLSQSNLADNRPVDLVSLGDLLIQTGVFNTSFGRKTTVLGSFTIDAGIGNVTLSDTNTGGLFRVVAGQIFINARPGNQQSFTSTGLQTDRGTDFVSFGGFDFSTVPLVLGTGPRPTFASPGGNGDLNGRLASFTMFNLDDAVNTNSSSTGLKLTDLFSGGEFFDAIADGTTIDNPANALAAAAAEFEPIESESASLGSDEMDQLQKVLENVRLRYATREELDALISGSLVFIDTGDDLRFDLSTKRLLPTAVSRLSSGRVVQLFETLGEAEEFATDNRDVFRSAVRELQRVYAEGKPLAEVVSGASAESNKLRAFRLIGELVRRGESLGLSLAERKAVALRSTVPWPQSVVLGLADAKDSDPQMTFEIPSKAFDEAFWSALDSAEVEQ